MQNDLKNTHLLDIGPFDLSVNEGGQSGMTRVGAVLLLLISMASIQVGASIAKGIFPLLGSSGTTLYRQGFAALILCLVWQPWKRIKKKALSKKEKKAILVYGLALGLMNLSFYMSLDRIPLGIAVAIEFTGPLAVALFGSKKPIDFLWAICAIVGVFAVLPFQQSGLDGVGLAYAFLAGICWGFYIVFGKKAGATIHSGIPASMGMVIATLVTAPVALIQQGTRLLDFKVLPMAFAVAILSGAIPYSLEMVALKKLQSHTFGILMSLEPALAALCGFAILHENLSWVQWGAIVSIMIASFGSALTGRSESNPLGA